MPIALASMSLLSASAMVVRPSPRPVARPALRLGGEWAGHCVTFSESGSVSQPGEEVLVTETWQEQMIHRQTTQLDPDGPVVSSAALPSACSGSTVLRRGASMLEADVLNARAWALDAVGESQSTWRCETIFDGLGGDRPNEREGALECPKERTRVQCSFDPATGALVPLAPVLVWQERCWSASPADDLDVHGVDASWASSVVGLECFEAPAAPKSGAASAIALGGGVELRCGPNLLEITLSSGRGSRNKFRSVVIRRSWAGDDTGRSLFAEVETIGDTESAD